MIKGKHILWGAGVTAFLLLLKKTSTKFHKLVKNQVVRGHDDFGSGAFLASRDGGEREHNGLDIITVPGEEIFCPVDGVLTRYSYPYGIESGLAGYQIDTDQYLIKLWYLAPNRPEGITVKKGEVIGFAQSLQGRFPGITEHVHIEVWDKTKNNVAIDPNTLF